MEKMLKIEKVIMVDSLIAKSIKLFNEKGYITKFCCSGHPADIFKIDQELPELQKDSEEPVYHFGSYVYFTDSSYEDIDSLWNEKILKHWLLKDNHNMYGYVTNSELKELKPEGCIKLLMTELERFATALPECFFFESERNTVSYIQFDEYEYILEWAKKEFKAYDSYSNDPQFMGQSLEQYKLVNLYKKVRNYALRNNIINKFEIDEEDEPIKDSFGLFVNGSILKICKYKNKNCVISISKCKNINYKDIVDIDKLI